MGKVHDHIDQRLTEWIMGQPMFFVGSAPSGEGGHINLSPKGPIGTFRVLDGHTVAYLDVVGSGAETIAHVRQNGRIVIMFCAFTGPPLILRLHGSGTIVQRGDEGFEQLAASFDQPDSTAAGADHRAVVVVAVHRIADSCGFGVPLMEQVGERPQAAAWVENKLRKGGDRALIDYMLEKNTSSLDGLAAVDAELLG